MRAFNVKPVDESLRPKIQTKIDNLNKPLGSMGELEKLAMQVCLVQHTLQPKLTHPCHILFGADHGIEREGVSIAPRDVTWQQMVNFARGGGGVNMLCRQHGFKLRIVDMGVDHDLSAVPGILPRKIAWGTRDFLHEPALTPEQMNQAINTGADIMEQCVSEGCNIVALGEMGIGNTSPSSLWMSEIGRVPLAECIGAGSGLGHQGVAHKLKVLTQAQALFHSTHSEPTVEEVMMYFGGFEMVAAVGAMLRAAESGCLILVDGFIMSACMLAASRLYPALLDYAIFGHVGDEAGHQRLLNLMQARPLLSLGMRLGEGTGALCSYPLVETSVRMINEMNNFQNAHIDKYF